VNCQLFHRATGTILIEYLKFKNKTKIQVKITLIRLQGEPNVIELSGRIDTEEAAEEELQERRDSNEQQIEDGLDCSPPSCPLKRVWPFLVQIFQPLLCGIDSYKTLPFNV